MRNIFVIVLLLMVGACSKEEIPTWEAKPRVWFTEASDTLVFSFYSQAADVSEYVLEIPISMAGMMDEADREVEVRDLGGRSFNPGSEYEIVSAIIPAGEVSGVLSVNVRRTENLSEANDTISFEILASDVFELGMTEEYWQSTIVVSNNLTQPVWWDSTAESYLGYYSDKKMEIIYTVLGSDEVFCGDNEWYSDPVYIAIYRLNRYCIDNNVKYNPEDENVIQFAWGTI